MKTYKIKLDCGTTRYVEADRYFNTNGAFWFYRGQHLVEAFFALTVASLTEHFVSEYQRLRR